jgi:hypothetical protein
MALDIITGVALVPRGGPIGTAVIATGVGFGVVEGRVIFDPTGQSLVAPVTAWADGQIDFTVPVGLLAANQFTRVTIEREDVSDTDTIPFWIPDPAIVNFGELPTGLDYQYPATEEGTGENVDNPRTATAADLNRMLDRMRFIEAGGGSGAAMLKSVYDPNDDGSVIRADALDDGGVPRTYDDIVALIGASGRTAHVQIIDVTGPVASAFTLDFTPLVPSDTMLELQGIGMVYGTTRDFHVVGDQLLYHGISLDVGDVMVVLLFHLP